MSSSSCSGGTIARKATTLVGGMLLTGCVTLTTPYQADLPNQRIAGGYSERRLDEGRYRVTFSATPTTRWADVERGLLRRCAELTVRERHGWFAVDGAHRNDKVFVDMTPDGSRRMKYSGDYDRWRIYWRLFRYRFGLERFEADPLWVPASKASRSRRREITGEVRMGAGAPPAGGFDAAAVLKGRSATLSAARQR